MKTVSCCCTAFSFQQYLLYCIQYSVQYFQKILYIYTVLYIHIVRTCVRQLPSLHRWRRHPMTPRDQPREQPQGDRQSRMTMLGRRWPRRPALPPSASLPKQPASTSSIRTGPPGTDPHQGPGSVVAQAITTPWCSASTGSVRCWMR